MWLALCASEERPEDGHGDNVTFSEDDIRPPLPAEGPGEDAGEPEQAPPLPQRSQEEVAMDFRDLLSEKVGLRACLIRHNKPGAAHIPCFLQVAWLCRQRAVHPTFPVLCIPDWLCCEVSLLRAVSSGCRPGCAL